MRLLIVLLCLLGQGLFTAQAEPAFKAYPNHSQARLLTSSVQISAEHDTLIGLQLKLEPDWHTYWQNPGDSGAAPILTFKAEPDIITFSPVQWPIPERIPVPPLMTFGYEREIMFWVRARLRSPYEGGRDQAAVKVSLEAEWLVCKVECIPAFESFGLSLNQTAAQPVNLPEAGQFSLYPLPQASPVRVDYQREGTAGLSLHPADLPAGAQLKDFFPIDNEQLGNEAPLAAAENTALGLKFKQAPTGEAPVLKGLLTWTSPEGAAYVEAKPASATGSLPDAAPSATPLWQFLLMAFVGGAILNLMPCVFPILAIKLLGLMKHADQHPGTIRLHSLAYILGAQLTFLGFALALAALRAGGQALGWGFQLQSPPALTALILLFFLLALNFLGLYEFKLPLVLSGKHTQNALWGQFSAGVLAVVVASPCTAPFMGAAMGFALTQSAAVLVSIFVALGLGFCLPYLLLLVSPQVVSYLPKPGAWMVLLKEAMAFPMLLTALWLLWILSRMVSADGLIALLGGLVVLSVPFWWAHRRTQQTRLNWLVWLLCLPLAGALMTWPSLSENQPAAAQVSGAAGESELWTPFSPARLSELKKQGAVFVDFTAAWCITCQVNERVTFSQASVHDAVKRHKVAMLKADWTRRDPEITKLLSQYGRISVPFYLLYLPGQSEPVILPELLTPAIFLDTLEKHLKS